MTEKIESASEKGPSASGEKKAEEPDDGAIVIYQNPEKKNSYRLGKPDFMPMNGSRILFSATPNRGKRNMILNIINRLDPPPRAIHIVHCNPYTIEYDTLGSLGVPVYIYGPEDMPTLENIIDPDPPATGSEKESDDDSFCAEESAEESAEENKAAGDKIHEKNESALRCSVVIVDECPAESLGKIGTHRFERLLNMIATHNNVLVLCSIQDMLNIPPKCRRSFNHIVLWHATDKNADKYAATRAGISAEILEDLYQLCKSKYDSIWCDLDAPLESPWRFRLNFTSPINIELGNST
jgi:hypothetical protein